MQRYTRLKKYFSQVAGYVRVPQWGAGCAPRQVELRSPACLRLIEGTPQGRQTGVAFSLATFFLAKQKKVTDETISHLTNPANDAG